MPQQRKQMTQTIFSTGFPLSFFFLSRTKSPQGKLPAPTANTERRLCCGLEPHGARHHPSRMGGWFPSPCAPKPLCSTAFPLQPPALLPPKHYSHHTASNTAHPQHLLARNLKNWASFWNKYSSSFHVWTHRKGKWLTRSYRASQCQQGVLATLSPSPDYKVSQRETWLGEASDEGDKVK